MMSREINVKKLRKKAHLTLDRLAELSGYGMVRLEQGEKVPSRMRESVIALLLQAREEGLGLDVRIWRERALKAENKVDILLGMVKGGMDTLDSSHD
ncbi:MAG: hypothetical protein LUE13_03965 [Akkermansiaceae bacterium]|nr:hypothetical protein [Akkermansiaceae bacterium]